MIDNNLIKEIMVEILEIDTEISDDFGPNDSPNWDSLNNLRLITAFEETFGIQLSMEDIESMKNFGTIKEVLQRRSA
jgi:acyl carrier protein